MKMFRRFAIAAAVLGAVLLCPVPYARVVGYDLKVTSADGRATTVRLPTRSAARAEANARALRGRGNQVTVEARKERVWGSVYAMARDQLFSIDVDTDGKTDAEIEAEIRSQLEAAGWNVSQVQVSRDENSTTTTVGADDGAGRVIQVVRKGDGGGRITIQEPQLDTTREPGMTDAQLRDKILGQLKARGLDGDVTVEGDKVMVRANRQQ